MKWTLRRNGLIQTTVAFSLHVPQDLVTWIQANTGMSMADAMDWVKGNVNELTDSWHTFYVAEDDASLNISHVDDHDELVAQGHDVYDGPMPTLAPTRRRRSAR